MWVRERGTDEGLQPGLVVPVCISFHRNIDSYREMGVLPYTIGEIRTFYLLSITCPV